MYGDLIVKRSDEMEELLRRWNVRTDWKVYIAKDVKDAKEAVRRWRAIFTPKVDGALLSLSKQNNVMLGFFTRWIREDNLESFIKWVKLVQSYRVPILIASGAEHITQLRSPHDRASIGILLGMDPNSAFMAVSKRWFELETHKTNKER